MLFRLCEEKKLADKVLSFVPEGGDHKRAGGGLPFYFCRRKKKEMTMKRRKIQTAEGGEKRKGERWWPGHRRKSIRVKRRKQTKILLYILIK